MEFLPQPYTQESKREDESAPARSWRQATSATQTSIHLFQTLVRPVMEYGDSIWAAMASNTALNELESLQCSFGRSILRCPGAAGEFVRSELGLCTVRERVHTAAMRFFGKLCNMD